MAHAPEAARIAGSSKAVDWLVRPWIDGGGTLRRAGRIYLFAAIVSLLVVPAMIAHYGADGWLWHITFSVLFFAPLGILAIDRVADRFERGETRRRLGVGARLALLFGGFALGMVAGYVVPVFVPIFPTPDLAILAADYGRNMAILTPVLLSAGVAGALLWYRGEAFRLESVAAKASFGVLKDRLQPHFLFNALGSLKELIAEDPAAAGEMTQRLADLYRLILQASHRNTIPLAEELAIVEAYLALERMRFVDRLRFDVDVADDVAELHVPSLVLQMLVENAVKHGVCKAREGGDIRVRARRCDDGWLELAVSNTGAPYAPGARPVSLPPALGLANTRARLSMLYGAKSQLCIASDAAGTRVHFCVSGAEIG